MLSPCLCAFYPSNQYWGPCPGFKKIFYMCQSDRYFGPITVQWKLSRGWLLMIWWSSSGVSSKNLVLYNMPWWQRVRPVISFTDTSPVYACVCVLIMCFHILLLPTSRLLACQRAQLYHQLLREDDERKQDVASWHQQNEVVYTLRKGTLWLPLLTYLPVFSLCGKNEGKAATSTT